jgi:hypothetical protein
MELKANSFRLQGRLPFRPRPTARRAPPKIPKCSRRRLACSFGGASFMLSQSRLNCSPACGRSRWSPSSGLAVFWYFCGDGGWFGGDGGSTVFSFTVERRGSTTGGFRLRKSLDALVNDGQERRETCKQAEEEIQVGEVPTHVQFPRDSRRQRAVKVRQRRDPATGTPPVGSARGIAPRCRSLVSRRNPVWHLLLSRQRFVRCCHRAPVRFVGAAAEPKRPEPYGAVSAARARNCERQNRGRRASRARPTTHSLRARRGERRKS